jgi:hypothetical protein
MSNVKNTINKYLAEKNIKSKVQFVERHLKNQGGTVWECFKWEVTFFNEKDIFVKVDYHMGLAHIDENKNPKAPSVEEVIYSLNLDKYYAELSFEEMCDELGYQGSTVDTRKIYNDCKQAKSDLELMFTEDQINSFDELFEEY